MLSISAQTRLIAIIGDPISHSITPRVQNVALQNLGAHCVNLAFQVAPQNLQSAIFGAQKMGFLALMVTIPHKEAVLKFCDELHASAQLLGAANLLELRADGKIIGHSSDGWGALQSLQEHGVAVPNAKILILGAGGSARSLALTFADAGASEIYIANRTVQRAQTIAQEIEKLGKIAHFGALDGEFLENALENCDLIVNTTSVGMAPNTNQTPLEAEKIEPRHTVFDIVYNPLETRLLREAKNRGARVVNGLDMVLYTNVYAVQTALKLQISMEILRAEALRALEKR